MAFSIRRTSGVGPAGSRIPSALGGHGAMDELNITPMVDVLLALLIIFMVVTPVLSEYAAEPPTATYVTPHTLEDAITLGIDQRGTFFLGPDTVPAAELPARLQALFRARPGDLLNVCWETGSGWQELCAFLGKPVPEIPFPHENKASDRRVRRLRGAVKWLLYAHILRRPGWR